MEDAFSNILTIKNFVALSEDNKIVQSVLQKTVKYDTLVLKTTRAMDTFNETFAQSEAFDIFWDTIGKSVLSLELHHLNFSPIHLPSYFNNLRELHIYGFNSLDTATLEFFHKNPLLEIISWSDTTNGIKFTKEQLYEKLTEILNICTNLKTLQVDYAIPLEANSINDFFSYLNLKIFHMDEIVFDCKPLPCWVDYHSYYFMIERFEMNFIKNGDRKKLIVRPLSLSECLLKETLEGCATNCFFEHQVFESKSVMKIEFSIGNKCKEYIQSCFKSFSHVSQLEELRIADDVTLHLMSKHLRELSCLKMRMESNTENWPSFLALRTIKITFAKSTYDSFKSFIGACPNLRSLSVKVNEGVSRDDCFKLISKHLKQIEHLRLTCGESCITTNGIYLINCNLTTLEESHIVTTNNKTNFKELYDKLPKLRFVDARRLCDRPKDGELKRLTFGMRFMEIPVEVWEEIFTCLTKNDLLRCRRVCRGWSNIISSSSKLNRFQINFTNCNFFWDTNPVQLFSNSHLHFGSLLIGTRTNFPQGEKLQVFWKKIGKSVEKLILERSCTTFYDAFKTGLAADHLPNLKELFFDDFYSYFNELLLQEIDEWKFILRKIEKLTFCNSFFKDWHETTNKYAEFEMSSLNELKIVNKSEMELKFLD